MAAALLLGLALALTQSGAATPVTNPYPAVADAYVRESQPNRNFGTAETLSIDASPLIIRSYLRFDLRDLEGTVTGATLRMRVNTTSPVGYDVRRVADDSWTESGIKYSNAPATGGLVGSSGPHVPGLVEVDVTPLVTGSGLVSLALTTSSGHEITAASRESTMPRPELIVETIPPPPPPETTITSGTSGTGSSEDASFTFGASVEGSSFECALDDAAFSACSSPMDYTGLAEGQHTFRVRATDPAGTVDPTPASRSWVIDSAPPETTITSGPGKTHRLDSAAFELASSELGATFECSLDGGPFGACAASPTFHVPSGSHRLDVRAVDAAGTTDPTPGRWEWWADALLANGNFETSARGWREQGFTIAGWKPHGESALISLVNGGAAGETAGRLRSTGSATMSMYSTPLAINSAVAGDTYTVRGQVRSETPGKKVCLRLRERSASSILATKQACTTTSGSWTDFEPITLTVGRSGSEIGVDAYQSTPTAPGDSFDLDGIELSDGRAPSILAPPREPGEPTLLAAGDIASCWSSGDEAVARLLDTMPGPIAVPGDTEQNHGSADEFAGCYDPSWGRHRARTLPAVGDHEYRTPGATGYFDYFGAAAGEAGKGWYSYDLGAWHIVVLNSNCGRVGGCGPGSEQYEWLRGDLERSGGDCIGAYWHHPLFSSGTIHGGLANSRPFWDLLYQHRAEWVLGGNDHYYQRFAPQTPTGERDSENGMRQFIVGTGGTRLDPLGTPLANTQIQSNSAFGVLRLGLHAESYDWQFVPQGGKTFTDSGSTVCSSHGDVYPPETTIDDGPIGSIGSASAAFSFSSNESEAEFRCSLDDQGFAPCSSPREYTDLAQGEHVFRVQAVDAGGNVDATPASRTWTVATTNLLQNGSFEGSLSGWLGYQSIVSLIEGGHDGQGFARVAPDGSGPVYTINTSPRPVSSSLPGATYQAAGWLRSETPGKSVCLQLRERVNGSTFKSAPSCRTATGTWEQFSAVRYPAVGGGSIELYASRGSAIPGESFDLDGLSLVALP